MAPPEHLGRRGQGTNQSPGSEISRSPNECDLYVVQMHRVWRPPTDVYETDTHIVVKVEIAGMAEEDLEISFLDRTVIVSGRRRDLGGKIVYQNMEIRYGRFETRVRVERPVDESAIKATYEQGFLYVRLPKAKEHRVRVNVTE